MTHWASLPRESTAMRPPLLLSFPPPSAAERDRAGRAPFAPITLRLTSLLRALAVWPPPLPACLDARARRLYGQGEEDERGRAPSAH